MLEITGLFAGYGETRVIHGLAMQVARGQFHAILGRNGVGKSTTLKTIMGLLPALGGGIAFKGEAITGLRPYAIARRGIGFVPETRDIFGSLTVAENLALAARLGAGRNGGWTAERVYGFFPNLAARRGNGGNQLSGGEQQMLAIGRALMMNPELLILDEPTEGLAPIIVRQIFEKLMELKREGMTLLLVEQNVPFALGLADAVSVFGRGQCLWSGTPASLRAEAEVLEKWLGV
jgi:branched-chain amino acid transport system ATP-binding protein